MWECPGVQWLACLEKFVLQPGSVGLEELVFSSGSAGLGGGVAGCSGVQWVAGSADLERVIVLVPMLCTFVVNCCRKQESAAYVGL